MRGRYKEGDLYVPYGTVGMAENYDRFLVTFRVGLFPNMYPERFNLPGCGPFGRGVLPWRIPYGLGSGFVCVEYRMSAEVNVKPSASILAQDKLVKALVPPTPPFKTRAMNANALQEVLTVCGVKQPFVKWLEAEKIISLVDFKLLSPMEEKVDCSLQHP